MSVVMMRGSRPVPTRSLARSEDVVFRLLGLTAPDLCVLIRLGCGELLYRLDKIKLYLIRLEYKYNPI